MLSGAATTPGLICDASCSTLATGVERLTLLLQQGCCPTAIWHSPTIFLQQAISSCVMVRFGRQASAGIAIHKKSNPNTMTVRNFATSRCYSFKSDRVKNLSAKRSRCMLMK